VFGAPLDGEHVHRPELVSALSGAAPGAPVTPAVVARVLGHPEGGRKGAPPSARVAVIINKVDRLNDPAPARETAARLLENPAIDRVLLTSMRAAAPVLEVHHR
jgi:probable selenium-dependent hydroxylase accessory protein YqeC